MYRPGFARICATCWMMLVAHPAFAELSALQVWQDWKNYMQSMGYQISATEEAGADGLIIRNARAQAGRPDAGTAVTMDLGTMRFAGQPDGTVSVTMPPVLPMTVSGMLNGTQRPYSASMRFVQKDVTLVASGTDEALTYDYDVGNAELIVDSVTLGERTYGADALSIVLRAEGLGSLTTMRPGALRQFEQTGAFANLSYDIAMTLPERVQAVTVTGSIANLTFDSSGTLPDMQVTNADAGSLPEGLTAKSVIAIETSRAELVLEDPETGQMSATLTTGTARAEFDVGPSGARYGSSQKDVRAALTVPNVPFPVEISLAEAASETYLPLPDRDPQLPLSGKISVTDLAASDIIWSILDPSGQLPRTPISAVADLSGSAEVFEKLSRVPAFRQRGLIQNIDEILEIQELRIETGDTRLETSGFMSFNGAGPNLIPGLGNPVGTLKVEMAGMDALMEDLANVGILPWEAAAAARLFLGMVALPGSAPGSSEILIGMSPEGEMLANGVPLR